MEVIREPTREPSNIEMIKGSYKANNDGIFTFIFDNTYSWFTDKMLNYEISLFQVNIGLICPISQLLILHNH